jgi:hypothetical protein
MAIRLSTNNGDFLLKSSYDYETGQSFYDVYLPASDDECGYGEWQGEYFPYFDIDDEYDEFVNHFEVWLDANDIVNLG